jgi:hypothetical protein
MAITEWDSAIGTLNPEVAIKITSKVVQAIMARTSPDAIEITLDTNTRIQILDEVSHLAGARKHQFAAFCRAEACLVVWADEVETVITSAEALEQRMIHYVWSGRHQELELIEADEKQSEDGWIDRDLDLERALERQKTGESGSLSEEEEGVGGEKGGWAKRERRPVMLYAPLISGLAIMLNCLFIGSGMRKSTKPLDIANRQANLSKKSCSMAAMSASLFLPLLLSVTFSLL